MTETGRDFLFRLEYLEIAVVRAGKMWNAFILAKEKVFLF